MRSVVQLMLRPLLTSDLLSIAFVVFGDKVDIKKDD